MPSAEEQRLCNVGNHLRKIAASHSSMLQIIYRCADNSLARTGRKQATATEDFEFHVSYILY
jgi:hypothetical protein